MSAIRARAAATVALCFAAATAQGQSVRLVVQNAPLAGFRYYAAPQVFTDLRTGDRIELVREPGNPHDPNAVRLDWRGRKLGYLPRRTNAAIAWALDRGEPLAARIARLRDRPVSRRRIEIEVYVE